MLVFGPYNAIPKGEPFIVFNLTSLTQVVPRLPGLFVTPNVFNIQGDMREQVERDFDMWYYDYVLEDPAACGSLMMILDALYNGQDVYVCIADYTSDPSISILNESFMKLIQQRYDIKYSIINESSDYLYLEKDGCVFQSVSGIQTFDMDRRRYMQVIEEEKIMMGGMPNENY